MLNSFIDAGLMIPDWEWVPREKLGKLSTFLLYLGKCSPVYLSKVVSYTKNISLCMIYLLKIFAIFFFFFNIVKSSVVKKCAVYSHHHNTGKFCDSDVKCKSLNIVPVCGVVCEFVIKLYVGETGDSWYSTERDMLWSITVIVVMSRRVMGIKKFNSCRWSGGNKTPGVNLVIKCVVLQVN